jgi:polyhydroxybutyrate depolymerase
MGLKAWSLGLLCLALAGRGAAADFDAEARELQRTDFDFNGTQHEVWLGAPAGRGPWPLVMALHGGGGVALGMARLSGFNALARSEGFLVAYPDSGVKAWNDGRTDFQDAASGHDDSAWLAALARDLVKRGLADPRRLYVCGMSNGGFMTVRLACEHPDLFAAAGVVAATLAKTYAPPPGAGLPICYINGTLDPLVPFQGGDIRVLRFSRSRGKVLGVEESLAFWRQRNGVSEAAADTLLPILDASDATRVRWHLFSAPGAFPVASYVIEGGGHA